jgi:hypothetical protein
MTADHWQMIIGSIPLILLIGSLIWKSAILTGKVNHQAERLTEIERRLQGDIKIMSEKIDKIYALMIREGRRAKK